jgi:hypothetical protein
MKVPKHKLRYARLRKLMSFSGAVDIPHLKRQYTFPRWKYYWTTRTFKRRLHKGI